MKRVIILVIALALVAVTASASRSGLTRSQPADGIDLSGYTFDELVALQEQVTMAMWNSDEWQEVTVPVGLYKIGEDIPAGKWTIRPVDGAQSVIAYGNKLDSAGKDLSIEGYWTHESICSKTNQYYKNGVAESITWELEKGYYIDIKSSAVVFTPYSGQAFIFK